MANRPVGYGYTREVATKISAKYSDEDEMEVVAWIASIVHENPDETGKEGFHSWLKDGRVLCKLMNTLSPGSCKPNETYPGLIEAMRRSKEMENIGMFLTEAKKYGVDMIDLFQTVDLYEGQNLSQVQVMIYKLSAVAMKNGYKGPQIGVKLSEKNPRDIDEQKTREGRNVIGLQMGTNQVASQEGMTPYGLPRQLAPVAK